MNRIVMRTLMAAAVVLGFTAVSRAEDSYTEGPVVDMTFVKVKPGHFEEYIKFIDTEWKALNEALKKEGLITAYRVVGAPSYGHEDWDLMLVVEYKNMAALDGLDDKSKPIVEKLAGSNQKMEEGTASRGEIREIIGEKMGRELILK